jgi:GNAT superfamily N-acetyltransferase
MPDILRPGGDRLSDVVVTRVGPDGIDALLDLPHRIEGGTPGFVAPLREVVRRELSGATVPGGAIQPFLCERRGAPVACAVARVSPRLADGPGAPVGQVGHLTCADDPEAARALLEAMFSWLRTRGARRVLAPMNGGVHLGHRAMVEGFGSPPFLLEPRNPPWIPRLLEGAGLAIVHRWRTWELGREALGPLAARLDAIGRRGAPGARVEWLDTAADPAGALERVHSLLDRAWTGNVAWAPITLGELAASFGVLLPLMPPRHAAVLVDPEGRDLGFGFMVPDWIDEVRALDGDVSGWGRWMGRARAARVIAHTVAMVPEARGRAAGARLVAAGVAAALDHGYASLVFPLTTERFRHWDHVLPPPTRAYALYGRSL